MRDTIFFHLAGVWQGKSVFVKIPPQQSALALTPCQRSLPAGKSRLSADGVFMSPAPNVIGKSVDKGGVRRVSP